MAFSCPISYDTNIYSIREAIMETYRTIEEKGDSIETLYEIQKSKFITTDGKKYYVGKTGARVYGWKKIKGKYYYFKKKTGVMKTGWLKIGKKKYCLSSSGARYTGWHTIGGKTYYFYKKTGVMAKNKKIGKYRVGKDGVRK